MGQPAHFSLEIVSRCRALIDHLLPAVREGFPSDARFGGPLTTTFLLSMATPMVVLPVERLFKPAQPGDVVADDRPLHDGLSKTVAHVFDDKTTFGAAPFNPGLDWRLMRGAPVFDLAQWGNEAALAALDTEACAKAACDASARFMMVHLRNALAHGGIIYLDAQGRQDDAHADMLGFISARIDWNTKKIIGFRVSRTSEADFLTFLRAWADWIETSGMAAELANRPPLAA